MTRLHYGKKFRATGIADPSHRPSGYPTAEDADRANVFRKLWELQTPEKILKRRWDHSAAIRKKKRSITLPNRPFDISEVT